MLQLIAISMDTASAYRTSSFAGARPQALNFSSPYCSTCTCPSSSSAISLSSLLRPSIISVDLPRPWQYELFLCATLSHWRRKETICKGLTNEDPSLFWGHSGVPQCVFVNTSLLSFETAVTCAACPVSFQPPFRIKKLRKETKRE
jgi:hypothetical protein